MAAAAHRRTTQHRRCHSLWAALGWTATALVVPGAGLIASGRRVLGGAVLIGWFALVGVLTWYSINHVRTLIKIAVQPRSLLLLAIALGVAMLAWLAVLVGTYLALRPSPMSGLRHVVGVAVVVVLCLAVGAPLARAGQYSLVQRDVVNTVFPNEHTLTQPTIHRTHKDDADADADDPWHGLSRVNVLLLGGDGGPYRIGIRTDSMILASIDTETGDTVLFGIPRNLMDVPFPKDSPLHSVYPHGFTGPGPAGQWMLNAVYRMVPLEHPELFKGSDNPGADALKTAIEGALGIHVDYYFLINLAGFTKVVDAMGGVTVNVNYKVPIGGNTDKGIPPTGYIQPGPHEHLDGWKALWFARGRYGLNDYDRMERQRCMVKAMIDAADPVTLLRRYLALADASKKLMRTDIPQKMLPAFVDLALKVKDADVSSVVFQHTRAFDPGDPDFGWVHQQVHEALNPAPQTPKHVTATASAGHTPSTTTPPSAPTTSAPPPNPCGYHPTSPQP